MADRRTPESMLLLALDLQGYGRRPPHQHRNVQAEILHVVDEACWAVGLDRSEWLVQPQGDGFFAVMPRRDRETVLVDGFLRHLNAALGRANETRREEARLRIRMAVSEGMVIPAVNGWAGESSVEVARLVGSDALRDVLRDDPDVDLAVFVSSTLFDGTVKAGLTSFSVSDFARVQVAEKEFRADAWLWRLAPPGTDREPGASPAEPATRATPTTSPTPAAGAGGHVATGVQAGRDAVVVQGEGHTVSVNSIGSVTAETINIGGAGHGR